MELTQEFLQVLDDDYSEQNVMRALDYVEHLIDEEEEYYQIYTEELYALYDLVKEFTEYITKGHYPRLKRHLNQYI